MLITHEVDRAVYECIVEHGIEEVTMSMVARRMGQSRTTFYRQYENRRTLLTTTHRRTITRLETLLPEGVGDLRFEFEQWWAAMVKFFRSPIGRCFLALRPCVATRHGMHEVEHYELELMPALARWLRAPAAATRSVWAMLLASSSSMVDERSRIATRELVWSIVGARSMGDAFEDAVDWSSVHCLAEPIGDTRPTPMELLNQESAESQSCTWDATPLPRGSDDSVHVAGYEWASSSDSAAPSEPAKAAGEPGSDGTGWDATPLPRGPPGSRER